MQAPGGVPFMLLFRRNQLDARPFHCRVTKHPAAEAILRLSLPPIAQPKRGRTVQPTSQDSGLFRRTTFFTSTTAQCRVLMGQSHRGSGHEVGTGEDWGRAKEVKIEAD